jgi:hypothetical protein
MVLELYAGSREWLCGSHGDPHVLFTVPGRRALARHHWWPVTFPAGCTEELVLFQNGRPKLNGRLGPLFGSLVRRGELFWPLDQGSSSVFPGWPCR